MLIFIIFFSFIYLFFYSKFIFHTIYSIFIIIPVILLSVIILCLSYTISLYNPKTIKLETDIFISKAPINNPNDIEDLKNIFDAENIDIKSALINKEKIEKLRKNNIFGKDINVELKQSDENQNLYRHRYYKFYMELLDEKYGKTNELGIRPRNFINQNNLKSSRFSIF
jgi:hypothetical protein